MLPSVRNNGYLKCRVKYVLIRWMILTCVDSCGCDICVWFGKGFCASAKVWKTFGFPDSRARSHAPKPPAAASICIRLRYMFTFAFANIIAWKTVICYWQLKRFGIQKRARALQPKMRRL